MPGPNGPGQILGPNARVQLGGDQTGDLYYRSAAGTLTRLPAPTGASGSGPYVISFQNGLPVITPLGTAASANTGSGSGNVPVLDSNGFLNPAAIPVLAIEQPQQAASSAARKALSAASLQSRRYVQQTDNGTLWFFSGTDPTQDGSWTNLTGLSNLDASTISTGVFAIARLGANPPASPVGANILYDNGWGALPIAGKLPFQAISGASAALSPNNAYEFTGAAAATASLPATASPGDVIRIAVLGAGGVTITQTQATDQIIYGNTATTAGTGGSLSSVNTVDSTQPGKVIALQRTSQASVWMAIAQMGIWNGV